MSRLSPLLPFAVSSPCLLLAPAVVLLLTSKAQLPRRRGMAQARNYLISRGLDDEDYVLWIDVDMEWYPKDMLYHMLAIKKWVQAASRGCLHVIVWASSSACLCSSTAWQRVCMENSVAVQVLVLNTNTCGRRHLSWCVPMGDVLLYRPIVVPSVVLTPGGQTYDANSWKRPDADVANSEKYRELNVVTSALDRELQVEGYSWTGPHDL
jgi:hypothetical protein